MPRLTCEIPEATLDELTIRSTRSGESVDTIVTRALAAALGLDHPSLFQVSSAQALVAGVTRGTVTVGELLRHGNLGLGTFDDLDGELVLLDSVAFQVTVEGVRVADSETHVPYAVVTNFRSDSTTHLDHVTSLEHLKAQLDAIRSTDNEFFAVRIDGSFEHITTRAVCKTAPATSLVDAARRQATFEASDIDGSILGFWSPRYATALTVAEWHLHFVDTDRRVGGHLLSCEGSRLDVQIQRVADVNVEFPESPEFLKADLEPDVSDALAEIE